ncbi:hypothetical protein [Streptomyces ardesiacus]|uniref:hypothetical protein n=1 Tax=Streptomyces ardesiacus TaxID=285564 RepID=UPI003F49B89D
MSAQGEMSDEDIRRLKRNRVIRELLAWLDRAITKAAHDADRWHEAECSFHETTIIDMAVLQGGATLCDCEGPASVRRRCTADRKLLDLHRPVVLRGGGGARYFETTTVCKSCEPPKQFPETAYPCPTIVSLAEGYGWTAPQTPPIEGDQVT